MTNTLSHAQNRHYRRIANRYEPQGKQSGQPIAGELTPAEKAHKARRHMRRLEIVKGRIKELSYHEMELSKLLREMEQGGMEEGARLAKPRLGVIKARLSEAVASLQKLTAK